MNKIDKFLKKLSKNEKCDTLLCLKLIQNRNFNNLNIKKLKGFDNLYRVRIGKLRIIY